MLAYTDDADQGGFAEHVDVEASNRDDNDDGNGDADADQGGVAKHGDIKASTWDDPDADADKQGGVAKHGDIKPSNRDTTRLVATTWGDNRDNPDASMLMLMNQGGVAEHVNV